MDRAWEHLPFLFAALGINAAGIAAKRAVGPSWIGWRRWFHVTLPVQPVVAGALIGLAPGIPAHDQFATLAGRVLYFAGAGVLSTWVYAVARQVARRHGYELPGTTIPPNGLK